MCIRDSLTPRSVVSFFMTGKTLSWWCRKIRKLPNPKCKQLQYHYHANKSGNGGKLLPSSGIILRSRSVKWCHPLYTNRHLPSYVQILESPVFPKSGTSRQRKHDDIIRHKIKISVLQSAATAGGFRFGQILSFQISVWEKLYAVSYTHLDVYKRQGL